PVDLVDPLQGLGGSAYLQAVHGKKTGRPPRCDLEQASILHATLLGLIQSGLIQSAHDCSEGGLAVALAESCISQQTARDTPQLLGAQIDLGAAGTLNPEPPPEPASAQPSPRLDALLFGETQ